MMKKDGPLFYDDFENYNSSGPDDMNDSDHHDDDDEDEEEEDILASNDQILGDWRSFRRKLAANEKKITSPTHPLASRLVDQSNSSNIISMMNGGAAMTSKSTTQTTLQNPNPTPKSPNEILLEQQNEKLAMEYHNDVWAHEIATVRALFFSYPLPFSINDWTHRCVFFSRKLVAS
jgi:hypothetical protein